MRESNPNETLDVFGQASFNRYSVSPLETATRILDF
jgi:hypothetical protein